MNEKADAIPGLPGPDLEDDLKALASDVRLRLLAALTRPRTAEEAAEVLGMTRQAARKHLLHLKERGFVSEERSLNERVWSYVYQVVPQRVFALSVQLSELGGLEPVRGVKRSPEATAAVPHAPSTTGSARLRSATATPAAPPRHRLLIVGGPLAGTKVVLEGDTQRWTIGRDADCSLSIRVDPYASARHCEVQHGVGGGHVLVDAFSSNGTYLNYARIPRGGRVPLVPGDVIGVGHTTIVYQSL